VCQLVLSFVMNMSNIVVFIFVVLLSVSCHQKDSHSIDVYFSKPDQDTLMTNIITNIYKVPRGVNPKDKHSLEYRSLYVSQIDKFQFVNYYIDPVDSMHYFFLIRPARNVHGHKRGVFGKFKLEKDLKLTKFEELANTPMMAEEEILEKGNYLWDDLMYFKNLDRFFLNKAYVEFPDDRTRYDLLKKEWTYEKLTY